MNFLQSSVLSVVKYRSRVEIVRTRCATEGHNTFVFSHTFITDERIVRPAVYSRNEYKCKPTEVELSRVWAIFCKVLVWLIYS